MEVTVEELLRIPLLKGSTIIGGKSGGSRIVKMLSFMDGYSGYLYLEKDTLAVTSGYLLFREPEKTLEFLRNIGQRGLSGIMLNTKYYDYQLPGNVVQAADGLGLPIIQAADSGVQFHKLFEYFNDHIYSPKTGTFLNQDNASTALISAMHVDGLPGLARQINAWTGKPVTIVLQDTLFCYPVESSELNQALSDNSIMKSCSPVTGHDALLQVKSASASGVGISFTYNLNANGAIWLDNAQSPCDGNDTTLLHTAKSACEIGMMQILAYEHDQSILKASFIKDLVDGRLQSADKTSLMARQLNLRIPKVVQVLVIQCRGAQDLYQQMEQTVQNLFRRQGLNIITFLHEQSLVVLLPQWTENQVQLLKEMEAQLTARWPENVFHFAVGRNVDFRKACTSYQQACLALKIRPSLSKHSQYNSFAKNNSFAEIVVHYLCNPDDPEEEQKVRYFCRDILQPLIGKEERGYDLIKTLRVFFHYRFNYRRTGQELYIHPSTVRYRLKVVEKLCGISLDNYDDVLNLQVALQLLPALIPEDRI